MMSPMSSEASVVRTYLDWMVNIPWKKRSKISLELDKAEAILNADHYGLEEVKERILEYLAVQKRVKKLKGPILCLVGPPGVGKTSLGESIARATSRKFVRMAVGGVRDEAEIRGHRRTYIGSLPGKLMQKLSKAGVKNPLFLLDEIDKMGMDHRGDPASALLEVLDPEQNSGFHDHYLDVDVDLSKTLFICTANQLDSIPGPLLDRMEVIHLSGYLAEEKLEIARNHLVPRQLERAGLKKSQLRIHKAALRRIIDGYAREAGVRRLEKQIGTLVRKAVVKLLRGEKPPIRIAADDVETYLGQPLFRPEEQLRGPGIVTGLAWTAMGGATLPVEARCVHRGQRGFKLTGQLGEVMRESAEIALDHVQGNAERLGLDPDWFDQAFVHLHVPAGATPKDGPSAGVTMATALVSLARNRTLRRNLAMTGELTLTGRVYPVGGIREKLVAARRLGVKEVILPDANRRDVDEIPEYVTRGLTIHFARDLDEVLAIALP
jgi:ATP-dependent Lon protease